MAWEDGLEDFEKQLAAEKKEREKEDRRRERHSGRERNGHRRPRHHHHHHRSHGDRDYDRDEHRSKRRRRDSEGNEDAARIDVDYLFAGTDWLSSLRAGVRYADRKNVARFSEYNWGVLSEIWSGGGPVWLSDNVDGIPGGTGGAPISGATSLFPFNDFLRGDLEFDECAELADVVEGDLD